MVYNLNYVPKIVGLSVTTLGAPSLNNNVKDYPSGPLLPRPSNSAMILWPRGASGYLSSTPAHEIKW
jgi:hypothetical protein